MFIFPNEKRNGLVKSKKNSEIDEDRGKIVFVRKFAEFIFLSFRSFFCIIIIILSSAQPHTHTLRENGREKERVKRNKFACVLNNYVYTMPCILWYRARMDAY